jgi:tripartite-type tricarboxylate transporter receptor subunit TctC
VIMTASVPLVLVVPASSAVNSVQELLALAKSKPGSLNYSSGGIGTSVHLAGVLFNEMAGVDILHIPYNGDGPAVVALIAKDVSMMFAALPSVASRLKSGELKALGVASPRRLPSMPNLPTISEAGVPGHEVDLWHGILAPAGTPKEVIAKLHDEIAKVLALTEVEKRMHVLGFERVGSTPEEFEAAIQADMKKWPALVKRSGAQSK